MTRWLKRGTDTSQSNGNGSSVTADESAQFIRAIAASVADELRAKTIVVEIPQHLDSKQVARLRETIDAIVLSVSLEAAKRNS